MSRKPKAEATTREPIQIASAADLPDYVPPKFPKVSKHRHQGWVMDCHKTYWCNLPDTPLGVLQLLHHLSAKTWADREFLHLAIERIFAARGWDLHNDGGGQES